MKSINIATATMLFFFSVNAQTRSFPVEKIQNLLNKAEGKKYVETLGNDMKITKQVITADSYTFYYSGVGKFKIKMVQESTDIPWYDGFRHYSTTKILVRETRNKAARFMDGIIYVPDEEDMFLLYFKKK